jgi:hypothetical protein
MRRPFCFLAQIAEDGEVVWEAIMKPVLALSSLLILAACTGPGPGITGNDTGGIIPYPLVASQGQGTASSDRAAARAMAANHCAGYNKRAVNVTVRRQYGEYAAFECSWR